MKNALVTGGTRGIGLAIAKMLIAEGYRVMVTYSNDEQAAQRCEKELSLTGGVFSIIRADQGDKDAIQKLVQALQELEHIDCIVFNAGITSRKPLQEISDDEWEHVMQVNVNSNVTLLRDIFALIPNNARIVFISSLLGILPHSVSLAYGVSKAAIIALAKNLVKTFAGTETTVNVIAPGFVDTEWQKNKPTEIRESICHKTALGRFAEAEEVADAVRFCINNAFVNGSVIEVSGGYDFR